jgi:hypothetical protein
MKYIHHRTIVFFILFLALLIFKSYGQVSQYVVEVKISSATEQTPLSISMELTQDTQIKRVVLHYREFGMTEYKELEMLLTGRTSVATIPATSMTPPYVEYYIEIFIADGTQATFPTVNPDGNPIRIQVKGVDPKDLEVRFLSPEPGETLAAEDLAVAVSLMFAPDEVDKQQTRLYLDGADVTKEALLSDDVILYSPKNFDKPLNLGTHSIKIELRDARGKVYFTKQTNFNLSTAAAIEEVKTSLQYVGNAQLEFRNEKIDVTNTTYTRGDLHLNGLYKFLMFGYDMHLTNENTNDRQPQNRFLATIQAADYAKIQVGDAYPLFPSLFISGKRVRGVTGAVTLGFFNLDVAYGKTERKIEGVEKGLTVYDDSSTAAKDNRDKKYISTDTVTGKVTYMPYERGTYGRDFIAIRPSFGDGESFQLGFTYIKAKDDTNSIKYGNYPAENFVAGTDLLLAFDNQKVKWTTQVAFSLENTNISGGNYTDADFDQYKLASAKNAADSAQALKDSKDLKDLAKLGRHFIIVNPNMSPIKPTDGFPSLAVESELTLNYFNNYVRAMVFRRGKDFKSYGNEFIQTDIEGINLSDRIRFFDNRLMTSFSYETKWNNIQDENIKPVTTFNTFNGSVTVYPGAQLPTFTLGYGFNTRKNPIDMTRHTVFSAKLDSLGNPLKDTLGIVVNDTTILPSRQDSLNIADEKTDRFFIAANYDFYMLAPQSLNATVSIANKKDNTFNLRNQDNVSFSTALTTSYKKIPMQTTIAIIISHNATYAALQDSITKQYLRSTQKQDFNYQTISFSARYRMMNERLNLLAALAPSFGDFKRTLVQAGVDYQVIENHYVVSQLDLIQNPGKGSDVVASLVYRITF